MNNRYHMWRVMAEIVRVWFRSRLCPLVLRSKYACTVVVCGTLRFLICQRETLDRGAHYGSIVLLDPKSLEKNEAREKETGILY